MKSGGRCKSEKGMGKWVGVKIGNVFEGMRGEVMEVI